MVIYLVGEDKMKKIISVFFAIIVLLTFITTFVYGLSPVKLNKSTAEIKVGEKIQLVVKGNYSNVKWSTADKNIAVVSSKGKVTGKSEGSVKITAKVNGKKLHCNVTVEPNPEEVSKEIANKTSDTAKRLSKTQVVDKLINSMTLEEKVGQLFYVRCPDSQQVKTVSKYHLGGYILFGKDFKDKSKKQIINNIKSYQKEAEIPLLIGVDEEGGTVVRVSSNPNLRSAPFLSPKDTYKNGGWPAIEKDAKEKAELLLSLGINVNMAPVCDMSDKGTFMYDRSFSSDVNKTNKFIKKYVSITDEKNLGTVLKHFPGYGNTADTHTGIAYDKRPYSQFTSTDFKPFITGIENGADCILVAHNMVNCMDKKYPASLSKKVHKIIRNDLKFDGVIMTDDLSMSAIRDYTGDDTAAVFAVKAGNDMLCCSDVSTQYSAVLKAVKNGEITKKQINNSVRRILNWKYDLGLL